MREKMWKRPFCESSGGKFYEVFYRLWPSNDSEGESKKAPPS